MDNHELSNLISALVLSAIFVGGYGIDMIRGNLRSAPRSPQTSITRLAP